MKIRWRTHELILVHIIACIFLGNYLVGLYFSSVSHFDEYASAFTQHRAPFNIYRNVILPDIAAGVLIYLLYLWLNRVAIPNILSRNSRKITLTVLLVFLFIFILGTAFIIVTYYRHEWQFSYRWFSIFFNNKVNAQLNVPGLYLAAGIIFFLYGCYAFIREAVIRHLENEHKRRAYRILVTNQVTLYLLVYLSILPFFLLPGSFHVLLIYLSLFSSIILVLINVHWLFPSNEDKPMWRRRFIFQLLLITFFCTFPLPVFMTIATKPILFFLSWAFQIFIVTPVSWLIYQQSRENILQLKGLEKDLSRSSADLQFLRSQINPHFLYNSLNTLYGTALMEGASRTAEGVQKLGDMMRFMLHENHLDFIPMKSEIEYLRNYIHLQKLRTETSSMIRIEDKLDERCYGHTIAPMLLIPFVENAFKHGISLNEKSWIKIKLHCNDTSIHFEVRNSLHPKKEHDANESSGIGLNNVSQRLELLYPGKYVFNIFKTEQEFIAYLTIRTKSTVSK